MAGNYGIISPILHKLAKKIKNLELKYPDRSLMADLRRIIWLALFRKLRRKSLIFSII